MFERQKYKKIARLQLKGRRGVPVLATLVSLAVVYLIYLPDQIKRYRQLIFGLVYPAHTPLGNALSFLVPVLVYFIYGVMTMAYSYLFIVMSHTTSEVKFSIYIRGFSFWLKGFLGFLWRLLWVGLWSLLFLAPGIVKLYAYSQMFFIMAENPGIPVRKAMRMSKIMTDGHKADLFVMDLSFLGWTLLSLITGGIAELWVSPYRMMARVNAFHALKEEALRVGVLEREDFEEGLFDSSADSAECAVANAETADAPVAETADVPVADAAGGNAADVPADADGTCVFDAGNLNEANVDWSVSDWNGSDASGEGGVSADGNGVSEGLDGRI